MLLVAGTNDRRIKEIGSLLARYEISARWLAAQLSISNSTLSAWLRGEGGARDGDMLSRAIEILQEEGRKKHGRGKANPKVRLIPVHSQIPAGPPGSFTADVEIEEFAYWGPPEVEVWGRVIIGESMAPVLEPGDIVVFHSNLPESGHVGHFFSEGEDLIKCLRVLRDQAQLWSFNDDHPPFPQGSKWRAKGECIARIRYGAFKSRQVVEFRHGLTWSMRAEKF